MADYSDYYNSFCDSCKRNVHSISGGHAPWCRQKQEDGSPHDEQSWYNEIFEKFFVMLDVNILTVDPLYECKLCYAVVRNWKQHYIAESNASERRNI